jgi:hypothetical protein
MIQESKTTEDSSTVLESSGSTTSKQALPASVPDQLTVLVFKDNSTPRTFRVPVRWISQFGWLLAAIFLISLVCIGVTVKALTFKSRIFNDAYVNQGAQSRVQELETQLKDAQDRIQAMSASTAPTALGAEAPVADTGAPVIDPSLLSASTPIESRPYLFKALPDEVKAPPAQVPIVLGDPSARWSGKTLTVRFNLQYVSKSPGGQQGRIIILARGPGMILTHPTQILQPVGKDVLIDPNKGEYFSVSRFREARADFGPLPSRDSIKEVEVMIISSSGEMLIHQKIIPGEIAARPNHIPQDGSQSDDSGSESSDPGAE